MTVEEELEELDDLPEVPMAAFSDQARHEINDEWLRTASVAEQAAALADWFLARFQDPAHETPYMTSEGGYIWTKGGPYDASDEIGGRFGGSVDDAVIEWVVDHVQGQEGVYDWAPTQLTYYDEGQEVVVEEEEDAPLRKLQGRIDNLLAVLTLTGPQPAVEVARNLTYAGIISALETFLWETLAYWVAEDEQTVRGLIEQHPAFKDRKVPLGSIFEVHESLDVQVRTHLQRMTWHRWDESALLFKHGLGVEMPSHRSLEDATQKRHDVIHRSGQDVDGNAVAITLADVRALAEAVHQFATELHRRIGDAKMPPEHRFDLGDA